MECLWSVDGAIHFDNLLVLRDFSRILLVIEYPFVLLFTPNEKRTRTSNKSFVHM